MSDDNVRFDGQFWAAGVFRNRHLHFAIRDVAEEYDLVGEIRWHLACQHELIVEGEKERILGFTEYLHAKVREQAKDLDDFHGDFDDPTNEFEEFTSVFLCTEEEAPVVLPDYIDELNRIDENEEVQDE